VARLQYAKGDLIIKEGDYGISIYEIISGRVGIFVSSEGAEIQVAALDPGMIVGGMTFLAGNTTPRSASAKALENCTLEAWHPAMLSNAYKQMPTVLKLITGQALKRLVRMNKMVSELSQAKGQTEDIPAQRPLDPVSDKRISYRKKVSMDCVYRPVNSPKSFSLKGQIRDISKGGLQLIVNTLNTADYSHATGDEFIISANLSPNQKVTLNAKIVWLKKGKIAAKIWLGMAIIHMTSEDKRRLGFFLMP